MPRLGEQGFWNTTVPTSSDGVLAPSLSLSLRVAMAWTTDNSDSPAQQDDTQLETTEES